MVSLQDILREILEEEKKKADRCKRIADRKYDKPSAYKSGAIVRCRQGDIWKDLKEGEYSEESFTAYKGVKPDFQNHNNPMFFTKYYEGAKHYAEIHNGKVITATIEFQNPLVVNATKSAPIDIIEPNGNKLGTFSDSGINDKIKSAGYDGLIINKKFGNNIDGWEILTFDSSTRKIKFEDSYKDLKEIGDSNPLNLQHIDTWHDGQNKASDEKVEEAIRLMTKAAQEAEKEGSLGEANYYKATVAWLKKDYQTVKKYVNDKHVKQTGNDEVLKRLLANAGKSYKDAYLTEDESLHKWFKRSGPKGKEGGWVDCNAPDGKGGYKACGRKEGEKRSKYPACRPTAAQCKTKGKGKTWGKTK